MVDQRSLKKFNKIYNKTYDKVLKFCICKCANIEDVNDIIQDIYLEIYKRIDKDIANIDAYIIGIARNKINKHYGLLYRFKRKSLNESNDSDMELIDYIPSTEDIENIIINNDDINSIWNYLKSKNITIQRIFYLYYVSGYKLSEIADILSKKENYIKTNLYRTLKEMQKYMKEGDVDE